MECSTERLQETSYQLSAVSYQPRKGNRKAQGARESLAFNRRCSPILADKDSDISPQRCRARKEKYLPIFSELRVLCAFARVVVYPIPFRKEKTRHWHIDWLTQVARIEEIWVNIRPKSRECECHRRVLSLPGARTLIPRFGSSDCRCPSHLAYFQWRPKLRGVGFQSTRGKRHQQFGTRRQP